MWRRVSAVGAGKSCPARRPLELVQCAHHKPPILSSSSSHHHHNHHCCHCHRCHLLHPHNFQGAQSQSLSWLSLRKYENHRATIVSSAQLSPKYGWRRYSLWSNAQRTEIFTITTDDKGWDSIKFNWLGMMILLKAKRLTDDGTGHWNSKNHQLKSTRSNVDKNPKVFEDSGGLTSDHNRWPLRPRRSLSGNQHSQNSARHVFVLSLGFPLLKSQSVIQIYWTLTR